MISTAVLTSEEYFAALRQWKKDYHQNYLAMYSSQWGGIVTDPSLWTVPADDHVVHRGDGVFEVFKCVGGLAYCLDDHLLKLADTVEKLAIKMPTEFNRIRDILRDLVRAGGEADVLVRITVTRGSGGFASNPYESPMGLLLITCLRLKTYNEETYQQGVRVITSPFVAKDPALATLKVCSYIQNVLMKKAALDAGADYAVCFGSDGFMTESSTENVGVITKEGELLAPSWDRILQGTTLTRIMALAGDMVKEGLLLTSVGHRGLTLEDVLGASEAFVCSTSTDVLPVSTWDGQQLGSGRQGPVAKELLARLRAECRQPESPFLTDLRS